eukprot:CAMPEP_0196593338 /NCGR_PEP_ID=MMETSP1081-20130531/75363_1 /TAXON_ID=36882 /ORGANISM="Pyramimonas amylifera, Strain CCMP720" /LENGTH=251 /DNA_ID=CAMNT_0041917295 /DNA_START=173 /DNA_END=928 /DNA_ORIENTATION=-
MDTEKKSLLRKKTLLSKKKLKAHKEDSEERGIVYMSYIPPCLKANKVRTLLTAHGAEILRIYLAPEDPALAKRRRQAGGKRGKRFVEGWIEFANKRDAKKLSRVLNGQNMGGKHFAKHKYDLWSLKYLKGFKWDHLTEEIAYQNAVRDQKMAVELRNAKKERDFYLSRVDKAHAIDAMEARKAKREGAEEEEEEEGRPGGGEEETAGGGPKKKQRVERHFRQRKDMIIDVDQDDGVSLGKDVLSSIFGGGS